ncbi:uncharacterized protein C8Q71DRAFT_72189 [Rhodofomes roseus]|uniref:Uncharacterized protein n=1 Tax=Rhodofomes roseus TaxID=34475 RepID=A0ABQ8KFD4_9APHY|nr:uncharacterized protein C8Q71DRAFT_72189 [Rhodofomes roseus]KAH9836225.1 hypothetical protein C8Q71DRAFT_72189 [Rhodofomes roseus]
MAVGPSAMSTTSTASTTTSTTSSSSTSSSSSSGSTSFSSNGTAALILAFLAIGLFVGGMLAMIGLRRRALGRAQRWMASDVPSPLWAHEFPDTDADGRSRPRRKKKDVGTPPTLYDIYAPVKSVDPASWQNILPLSAKTVSQSSPRPPVPESEDVAQGGHHRWHFDALGFFHWPPAPTAPPSPPALPEAKVAVAVVVAMPVPSDAEFLQLDYTLGLTQLTSNCSSSTSDTSKAVTLANSRSDHLR